MAGLDCIDRKVVNESVVMTESMSQSLARIRADRDHHADHAVVNIAADTRRHRADEIGPVTVTDVKKFTLPEVR